MEEFRYSRQVQRQYEQGGFYPLLPGEIGENLKPGMEAMRRLTTLPAERGGPVVRELRLGKVVYVHPKHHFFTLEYRRKIFKNKRRDSYGQKV